MNFKFNLGIKASLSKQNFSLSELVIATKQMFVSDGEPGMVRYLKKLAKEHQPCVWHLPYELPHVLRYQDKTSLEEARDYKSELQSIIEIKLLKDYFKEVLLEDKLELKKTNMGNRKKSSRTCRDVYRKGLQTSSKVFT